MKSKRMIIGNGKQKGFTMIEMLFAVVLGLLTFISSSVLIQNNIKRDLIDEIAYTTAQQMHKLSIPAQEYIDDNVADGLPDSFGVDKLIQEGYVSNKSSSNLDQTPLGRELRFYVNNDHGFSLSIAMYQVGTIPQDTLETYGLDNDLNMESLQRKISIYLKSMTDDHNYDIGIVDEDYYMDNPSSSNRFTLETFIKRDQVQISSQKSTALFFTMQEHPGYWVLNMNSQIYLEDDIAEENANENKLYSIGFSTFCPSDESIQPEQDVSFDPITRSEMRRYGGSAGNNYRNSYICLPASELVVDGTLNADGDTLGKEIPLLNEFDENYEYKELLGDNCLIRQSVANLVEFKIGQQYYTLHYVSGRVTYSCYSPSSNFFHASRVEFGKYEGIDEKPVTLQFNSTYYSPETKPITINRVTLK